MQEELLKNARVLIVDDEVDNVELLQEILRFGGYNNLRSTTVPQEVPTLSAAFQPDLILLDLMMPDVDGFQVMEQLKSLIPEDAYVPILVITGDYSPQTRNRALTGGAKDFLTKPFDTTEVLLRVRNLLETRFLHLELQAQNQLLAERVRERTSELTQANADLRVEIAERSRTEAALRQSEVKFRSVVESATDAIVLADSNDHIIGWNKGAQAMFGYAAAEVIGRPLTILIPERYRAAHHAALPRFNATQEVHLLGQNTELYGLHKDGLEFQVEVAVSTWDIEGEKYYSGIVRDVTTRRRAERDLRHSEMLLAEAERLSHVGSWDWNVRSDMLDWSDELYRIHGLSPQTGTTTHESFLERVHPADREFVKSVFQKAGREHEPFDFQYRAVRPDGTVRHLHTRGVVVIDENANPIRMFGSGQDVTELKQAETELEESRDELQTVLNAVPGGVSWISSDLRYLGINSYLARLLNLTPDEVIGQEVGFLQHNSGFDTFVREFFATRVRADEREVSIEADGGTHIFWVMARKYEHGRGAVFAGVDITERKRAEAALQQAHSELEARIQARTAELTDVVAALRAEITERQRAEAALHEGEARLQESEARLRAVVTNAPIILWAIDREGVVTLSDGKGLGAMGHRPGELIGQSIFDLYADAPEILDLNRRALAGEEVAFNTEVDGVVMEARLGPLRDGEGNISGVIGVAVDITERTQAEAALHESEARFKIFMDNSPAVAFVKDEAGQYLYVNRLAERIAGNIQLGKTDFDVLPAEIARELREHDQIVLTEGRAREIEETVPTADGQPRSWFVLKFPFHDASGRRLLGGMAVDITERKQVEADAQQARAEADRANRAKSEFLSRMSHELRTPLNAILGFTQLMALDERPPRERQNLDYILKAGQHLLALVNEVLEIARIETGQMSFSIEPVHVASILQEDIDLVRPLAADHQVQIHIEHSCDRWVLADRQRLKQVLLNLLSNAIKYNRDEGEVRLSCEVVGLAPPEASEEALEEALAGRLRIQVSDTGLGISQEMQGRLFIPFDRLGAEHSGIEGTGIGLALSKRLIEAMGGSIGVESTVGEGSTFWVELPLTQSPLATLTVGEAMESSPEASASARALTILYIEDNLSNLRLIEGILALQPGIRLLAAMQGSLGLELAREQQPDAILLDLHLPDISGDEVLQRLKAETMTRSIPVIILSADAIPSRIERLLASGAHAYLTKPLQVRQFLQVLEEMLPKEPSSA